MSAAVHTRNNLHALLPVGSILGQFHLRVSSHRNLARLPGNRQSKQAKETRDFTTEHLRGFRKESLRLGVVILMVVSTPMPPTFTSIKFYAAPII